MYVVVGLGNPGPAYEKTRHNVGFEVIDRLAERLGADAEKKKFSSLVRQARWQERSVLLVKPQTYMNCSGQAVAAVLGFYRLGLERLLVITDDAALEPGQIRLRAKGSSGGHKGLADIIEKVKSEAFARLRVGIGSCPGAQMADYVLSRPSGAERVLLERAAETAAEAVVCWLRDGIEAAMNRYNSRERAGLPGSPEPEKKELDKPDEKRNP
jgi:PTH1 family peptidyl-tRNA hydrolase